MIDWNLLNEKVKTHMKHDSCGHGFDHVERVSLIAQKLMQNTITNLPTEEGFFGSFGGQYITDELKQEYTTRQYLIQIAAFAIGAGVIGYLYFYNLVIVIIY